MGLAVAKILLPLPRSLRIFVSREPVMKITGFSLIGAGPKPRFSATFEGIWVPWQDVRVLWRVTVIIVQSVRTPGCGPGGRGFESHWSPQENVELGKCEIAELVVEYSFFIGKL